MSKTQIAFFGVSPREKKYLEEKFSERQDYAVTYFRSKLSPRNAGQARDIRVLGGFVDSKIDRTMIEKLPELRLVTTLSTGFDHIDLEGCATRGITVCNVPLYGEETVAEHTFALILSLARKIPQSMEHVRRLDFDPEELQGFDLAGKTLGIVGLGHIGEHVAKIACGFDMRILVSDPGAEEKVLRKYHARAVSLETLLRRSDIITLHAPLNARTHHLINRQNIELIKRGAYIINTARGGLIETEALLTALNQKIIAGAGIDVLEEESFIKEERELVKKPQEDRQMLMTVLQDHLLLNNPHVIITPHNAFNSKEALQRILDTTVLNIERFIAGKPINVIRPS